MKKYFYYLIENNSYVTATASTFYRTMECYKSLTISDSFHITSTGWVKFISYYSNGEYVGFRKEILTYA